MATDGLKDPRWLAPLLPSAAKMAEITGGDPASALLDLVKTRAPIEPGFNFESLTPAQRDELAAELLLAVAAAKRLKDDPSAVLSDDEVRALHALAHLVARPSLRLMKSELTVPPSCPRLHATRATAGKRAPGIGRLDAAGGRIAGTGWFVTKDLLLTNAHVVGELCGISPHDTWDWHAKVLAAWKDHSRVWETLPAARPIWDPGEAPRTSPDGRIVRIRAVHDTLDMALLEITGVDGTDLALKVSGSAPPAPAPEVCLIGYPFVGETGLHPVLRGLLFGDPVAQAVKRVAPGVLTSVTGAAATHDASTLGGSSGSPIFGMDAYRVYGLHAQGQYGVANHGIALWQVQTDPFFTTHGIPFVA